MRKILFSLMLLAALLAAAFGPLPTSARAQDDEITLKMGLLPILDVLPFYVAQEAGYFETEGVNIELIPVSSALERDQLLLAGEIDGMLNDLVSTGIFNADDVSRLAQADLDAILVGEALLTAADIAAKEQELSGIS